MMDTLSKLSSLLKPNKPVSQSTSNEQSLRCFMLLTLDRINAEASSVLPVSIDALESYFNELYKLLSKDNRFTSLHNVVKNILQAVEKEEILFVYDRKQPLGIHIRSKESATVVTVVNRSKDIISDIHEKRVDEQNKSGLDFASKPRISALMTVSINKSLAKVMESIKKIDKELKKGRESFYSIFFRFLAEECKGEVEFIANEVHKSFLIKSPSCAKTTYVKNKLALTFHFCRDDKQYKQLKTALKIIALENIKHTNMSNVNKEKVRGVIDNIIKSIRNKDYFGDQNEKLIHQLQAKSKDFCYNENEIERQNEHNIQVLEKTKSKLLKYMPLTLSKYMTVKWKEGLHKRNAKDPRFEYLHAIAEKSAKFELIQFENQKITNDTPSNWQLDNNLENILLQLNWLCGETSHACFTHLVIERLSWLIKRYILDEKSKGVIRLLTIHENMLVKLEPILFNLAESLYRKIDAANMYQTIAAIANSINYLYICCTVSKMAKLYAKHNSSTREEMAHVLLAYYFGCNLSKNRHYNYKLRNRTIRVNVYRLEDINDELYKEFKTISGTKPRLSILSDTDLNRFLSWAISDCEDNTTADSMHAEKFDVGMILNRLFCLYGIDFYRYFKIPKERRPPYVNILLQFMSNWNYFTNNYAVFTDKIFDYHKVLIRLKNTLTKSLTRNKNHTITYYELSELIQGCSTAPTFTEGKKSEILFPDEDATTVKINFDKAQSGRVDGKKNGPFTIEQNDRILERQMTVLRCYSWKELAVFIRTNDDKILSRSAEHTLDTDSDSIQTYIKTIVASLQVDQDIHYFAGEVLEHLKEMNTKKIIERAPMYIHILALYYEQLRFAETDSTQNKYSKEHRCSEQNIQGKTLDLINKFIRSDYMQNAKIVGACVRLIQAYLLQNKNHNSNEYKEFIINYCFTYSQIIQFAKKDLGKSDADDVYDAIVNYHEQLNIMLCTKTIEYNLEDMQRSFLWHDFFDISIKEIKFDKGVLIISNGEETININVFKDELGGVKQKAKIKVLTHLDHCIFMKDLKQDDYQISCDKKTQKWSLKRKDSDIEIEINSDAQVFANLEGMAYQVVYEKSLENKNIGALLCCKNPKPYIAVNNSNILIANKNGNEYVRANMLTGKYIDNKNREILSMTHAFMRGEMIEIRDPNASIGHQNYIWHSEFNYYIDTQGEIKDFPDYQVIEINPVFMKLIRISNKEDCKYIVNEQILSHFPENIYDPEFSSDLANKVTGFSDIKVFHLINNEIQDIESGNHLLVFLLLMLYINRTIDIKSLKNIGIHSMVYTNEYLRFAEEYYNKLGAANYDFNHYPVALYVARSMLIFDRKLNVRSVLERYLTIERKITYTKLAEQNILELIHMTCNNDKERYIASVHALNNDKESHLATVEAFLNSRDLPLTTQRLNTSGFNDYVEKLKEVKEERKKNNCYVSQPSLQSYVKKGEKLLPIKAGPEQDDLPYVQTEKLKVSNFESILTTNRDIKTKMSKLTKYFEDTSFTYREMRLTSNNQAYDHTSEYVTNSIATWEEYTKEQRNDLAVAQTMLEKKEFHKDLDGLITALEDEIKVHISRVKEYLSNSEYYTYLPDSIDERWVELIRHILKVDGKLCRQYGIAKDNVDLYRKDLFAILILKTELQHFQRIKYQWFKGDKCLSTKMLTRARAYKIDNNNVGTVLSFALLELQRNVRLSVQQTNLVKQLHEDDTNIVCAPIGSGKTFVLSALLNIIQQDDRRAILILPESLLPTQGIQIQANFEKDYGEIITILKIDPYADNNESLLEKQKKLLKHAKVVITTRESIQGLKNVLLTAEDDRNYALGDTCRKILMTIKESRIVCDEVDAVFSVLKTIIVGIGSPKPLEKNDREFYLEAITALAAQDVVTANKYPKCLTDYEQNYKPRVDEIINETVAKNKIKMTELELKRLKNNLVNALLPSVFINQYDLTWHLNHATKCAEPLENAMPTDLQFKEMNIKVVLTIIGYLYFKTDELIKDSYNFFYNDYQVNFDANREDLAQIYSCLGSSHIKSAGLDMSIMQSRDDNSDRHEANKQALLGYLNDNNNYQLKIRFLKYCIATIIIPDLQYLETCYEQYGAGMDHLCEQVNGCTGTPLDAPTLFLNERKYTGVLPDGIIINQRKERTPCATFQTKDDIYKHINAKTQILIDPTQQLESSSEQFAKDFLVKVTSKNKTMKWVMYYNDSSMLNALDINGNKIALDHTEYNYLIKKLGCDESQWCIIMDAGRSRGCDIVLANDAHAILIGSPHLEYSMTLQAIGRCRKGETQEMTILLTMSMAKDLNNKLEFMDLLNWLIEKEDSSRVARYDKATQQRAIENKRDSILDIKYYTNLQQYKTKNDPRLPLTLSNNNARMLMHTRVVEKDKRKVMHKTIIVPTYKSYKISDNKVIDIDNVQIYFSNDLNENSISHTIAATRLNVSAVKIEQVNDQAVIVALSTRDIANVTDKIFITDILNAYNTKMKECREYYQGKKTNNSLVDIDYTKNKLSPKIADDILYMALPWLMLIGGNFNLSKALLRKIPLLKDKQKQYKLIEEFSNWHYQKDFKPVVRIEQQLMSRYPEYHTAQMQLARFFRRNIAYNIANSTGIYKDDADRRLAKKVQHAYQLQMSNGASLKNIKDWMQMLRNVEYSYTDIEQLNSEEKKKAKLDNEHTFLDLMKDRRLSILSKQKLDEDSDKYLSVLPYHMQLKTIFNKMRVSADHIKNFFKKILANKKLKQLKQDKESYIKNLKTKKKISLLGRIYNNFVRLKSSVMNFLGRCYNLLPNRVKNFWFHTRIITNVTYKLLQYIANQITAFPLLYFSFTISKRKRQYNKSYSLKACYNFIKKHIIRLLGMVYKSINMIVNTIADSLFVFRFLQYKVSSVMPKLRSSGKSTKQMPISSVASKLTNLPRRTLYSRPFYRKKRWDKV